MRHILAAFDDRQVGVEVAVADRLQEREAGFEVPRVQVVEEQPADPAGLVAVFEMEILVAPLLVFRIHVAAERRTQVARDAVLAAEAAYLAPNAKRAVVEQIETGWASQVGVEGGDSGSSGG